MFFKSKPYKQKPKTNSNSKFILYKNSTTRKKPKWVRNEILKIKAIDRNLSIDKTFVAYTLGDYKYKV